MGVLSPDVKVSWSPLNYTCSQTLHQSGKSIADTKLKEHGSSVHSHLPGTAKQDTGEDPARSWHDGMWAFGTPPSYTQSPTHFQGHFSDSLLLATGKRHEMPSIFYKLSLCLHYLPLPEPLNVPWGFPPLMN